MTCHARWIGSALLAILVGRSDAQSPVRPEFEVASIKLNTNCGNSRGGGGGSSPGRLSVSCNPLRALIRAAYGTFATGAKLNTKAPDVLGGPSWLDSELYDLNAKAAGGAPLDQTMGPMLQMLLEDRCKLKIHKESREAPVYALTVAKGGARLHASSEGSCAPLDLSQVDVRPSPGQARPNPCGFPSMRTNGLNVTRDGSGMTMAEFAARMLNGLDRPVVDKTGLTGSFDIQLEYMRDAAPGDAGTPAPSIDTAGPSIFTAVQEQLGLKLSPDKGPVEVLVIDHVEKPSEN